MIVTMIRTKENTERKKRPTPALKKVMYVYEMCVLALVPDVGRELI
jgi:hypothetical protein